MRIRTLTLGCALLILAPAAAYAGSIPPPGPQATPACDGGNSVLGYTSYGAPLVCGTALASGSIANGSTQLGVYIGLNTIGPLTPSGDVSFANPAFTVTSLRAGKVSVPDLVDTAALLAAPQTFTTKTINCANNTCTVRANVDLTGALAAANFPALTGDVTTSAGSLATAIAAGAVTSATLASNLALPGAPTTTTPANSDSSTKIATTAYVQAIGGNLPLSYNSSTRNFSLIGPSNLTSFLAGSVPVGSGSSPFAASSILDNGLGVTIGSPVGGAQGSGTINTTGIFVNGVAVTGGGGGGGGATTCQGLSNAAPSCFVDTTNAANVTSGDLTAARMSANLSSANDVAFGAARGDILYRGATGWTALPAGVSGQFLQSAGPGADPQYASVTATAGGSNGQLQVNTAGLLSGLTVGGALTAAGGTLNVGPAGISAAMLASGAASSNVGALTGDVTGTLPAVTVTALNGAALGSTSPAAGNLMVGSGTQWVSRVITGDVTFTDNGQATSAAIGPMAISAGKLADGAAATNVGSLGSDLSGLLPNPAVIRLQGRAISNAAPNSGDLLGWNGSTWGPTTAPVTGITQLSGAVTAGPGPGSQVATIAPTGVTSGSYQVGSDCWAVSASGQITSIAVSTSCVATPSLTADDTSTVLTADDGVTALTAL